MDGVADGEDVAPAGLDDDLILRAARIGGDPAGDDHLQAGFRADREPAHLPLPDHAGNRGAFVLVARYPGSNNPAPRKIGDYPATSLAAARKVARDWLEDLRSGVDPKVKAFYDKSYVVYRKLYRDLRESFRSISELVAHPS